MNCVYNSCMSGIRIQTFVACNVMCMTVATYTSVGLVRDVDVVLVVLFPSWVLVWLGLDLTLFPFLAETRERSGKFVWHWRGRRLNKTERKMLVSFRPMEVRVGGFYSIGKTTALTLLMIVSNLSVNALLAFWAGLIQLSRSFCCWIVHLLPACITVFSRVILVYIFLLHEHPVQCQ